MIRKYSLVLFLVFYVFLEALAQEPRPAWVRQVPFPPAGANYILVYGMGIGNDEKEAEFAAWKNAIYKALNEGGLIGFTTQVQSLDKVMSMEDLQTQIPMNILPRRQVCQTLPIYINDNKVKIYVLLQVKRNGGRDTDFYKYGQPVNCEDKDFNKQLKGWNKSEYKRKKQDKQKKIKKGEEEELAEEPIFFKKNHQSYFLWGILETGISSNISTSIVGRHGRNLGIGYYASAGVSLSSVKDPITKNNDFKSGFHYSAGIRLYMFQTCFLSAGYGSYEYKRIFNSKNPDKDIWEQSKGTQFTIGVDWLGDMNGLGWGASFEGGVSSTQFGIMPLFKVKICVGLGL